MQVAKWGNSLAIRLPKALVELLNLREGDEVHVRPGENGELLIARDWSREEALETIRRLRRPAPEGWRFDRDEANAR